MDLRKTVSWLALFVGVMFLVIGAAVANADYDYSSEYIGCDKWCRGMPGGMTYNDCMKANCDKYFQVKCSDCKGCTGGGFNIPCDKSTNSVCGDANPLFCNNGLCVCSSYKIPALPGDMYYCSCIKPT